MARIVCIGEAMVELSEGAVEQGFRYGGDTIAAAVHFARLRHDVAVFTAVGTEPASHKLREAWAGEGIDTSLVLTAPTREAGLYAITSGPQGQRRFSYWREDSAARALFALAGSAPAAELAAGRELACFSLESLAILPDEGREALLGLARAVRERGGQVAFDGNYRPVLWSNRDEAISWRDAAIAVADIGLPTWDDEMALAPLAPQDVAAHWRALGCGEVVVKLGADGCLLPDGSVCAPPERLLPVDTSGVGDAFDAGYLSVRLNGGDLRRAAEAGHRLAAWTLMRRGAIPPRDADYPEG